MIETIDHKISPAEFRKNLKRHMRTARDGEIVGIREGGDVVGVYMSADVYETLYGAAIKQLLKTRMKMKGAGISNDEVRGRVLAKNARSSQS